MIVNDDSRLVNKLDTSLTDNARVVNYNCHMFIVLATESSNRAYALNQRCRGRDQIQADVQNYVVSVFGSEMGQVIAEIEISVKNSPSN